MGAWEGFSEQTAPDMSFEQMAVLRPELLTLFTRHKVAEWFRGRDTPELPSDGNDSKAAITDSATAAADAAAAEEALKPTPRKETSKTDAETPTTAPKEGEEAGADGVTEAGEGTPGTKPENGVAGGTGGGEGEEETAEKTIVLQEEKDVGAGEAGDAGNKAATISEAEVAKLKEEQEARVEELAMNVNVFMPYKVGMNVSKRHLLSGADKLDRLSYAADGMGQLSTW